MPLPHELTTASSTVKAGIRSALGLLSAALRNTGTAQNEIPLLGVGGKLAVALIPTGTAEGLIPIIGAGGKLPIEIMPDGVGGGGSLFATKIVANQAARLALTTGQARGFVVLDADTGKSWGLVTGGTPATSGDWVQVGDRDIVIADVAGLATALAGKVGTGGEGVNAGAFLAALGIAPPENEEERRQERLEIGVTESVTVRRVTPTMSPDVSSTLTLVPAQLIGGQPVWSSSGLIDAGSSHTSIIPPPTGAWVVLYYYPGDGWNLRLYQDGDVVADWVQVTDPSAYGSIYLPQSFSSGVVAVTPSGDDMVVAASLVDPRTIGDYYAVGTLADGQEVWTKDGVPFTGGNGAAMVFQAGFDEIDDGTYNLSFFTAGAAGGSGFYSTATESPPPVGSWTAFGDEVGRIEVTAIDVEDRISPELLPSPFVVELTESSTVTPNFKSGQLMTLNLTGNRTLGYPLNVTPGTWLLRVQQDGTGGHALTFGAGYHFQGGTPPVVTATPGAVDVISFVNFGGTAVHVARQADSKAVP